LIFVNKGRTPTCRSESLSSPCKLALHGNKIIDMDQIKTLLPEPERQLILTAVRGCTAPNALLFVCQPVHYLALLGRVMRGSGKSSREQTNDVATHTAGDFARSLQQLSHHYRHRLSNCTLLSVPGRCRTASKNGTGGGGGISTKYHGSLKGTRIEAALMGSMADKLSPNERDSCSGFMPEPPLTAMRRSSQF
jgi:hypothetical protein